MLRELETRRESGTVQNSQSFEIKAEIIEKRTNVDIFDTKHKMAFI